MKLDCRLSKPWLKTGGRANAFASGGTGSRNYDPDRPINCSSVFTFRSHATAPVTRPIPPAGVRALSLVVYSFGMIYEFEKRRLAEVEGRVVGTVACRGDSAKRSDNGTVFLLTKRG